MEENGDFVTLTADQLEDPYQAGMRHGKDLKMKEILVF